ncbi:MAG TPA: adenylyl-sulfate kinase [Gammaproteobacteria bacterium]|nr:adenylyl-sulfate kinase [Gammaproteobacteria bacterium]
MNQPAPPGTKKSSNVVWCATHVSRADRERLNGHRGAVLWFTGLSGSGKSTISSAVESRLHQLGCRTYVCDGDNIRHGLNGDLGFSPADRVENIRRIAEVAKLFLDAGMIVLTAFISPYRADRAKARERMPRGDFIEVYCRCPLEVCERRDVKGMYRRARAGEIKEFTGISAPYEEPEAAEIVLNTDERSQEECVDAVIRYLRQTGVVAAELP